MSVQQQIEEKLTAAFAPDRLEVINESHRHAGHAGSPGTGESHFAVLLVAAAFDGRSRVERQRAVHAALAEELAGPVHALSLTLKSPQEAGGA